MDLNDTDEINVNQIQEIHYQRLKKRIDVFEKVLKQCYRVIKQAVLKEEKWCIYTIPEIIFGNPLYKIPDCANYIYRSLIKNGFTVKYIFPNHLVIIWSYKKNGQKLLGYPTVTQNHNIYNNKTIKHESVSSLKTLPQRQPQPIKQNTSPNKNTIIDLDIIKRGSNNKTTHSTKEFKPSGMFLFNKKK